MTGTYEEEGSRVRTSSGPDSGRSKIPFPYMSLDAAAEVVSVIHNDYGTQCDHAQLSGGLNTTVTSSRFRMLVSAAKLFGLIEKHSKVAVLTELGRAVVDPMRNREALAEAFLTVPLYHAIYTKFAGQVLPGDAGLEAEIRSLGVMAKSAPRARQTLQRSADYAGFFGQGRDRLVRPGNGRGDTRRSELDDPVDSQDPASGPADASPLVVPGPSDELLKALWSKLPADRAEFPNPQRSQWIDMVGMALNMVYGPAEDTPITDGPI